MHLSFLDIMTDLGYSTCYQRRSSQQQLSNFDPKDDLLTHLYNNQGGKSFPSVGSSVDSKS